MLRKNHDGIQTFLISEIGNGTERFYIRFSKDFEFIDPNHLGFQESEVTLPQSEAGFQESEEETGISRLDFENP